MNHSTAVHVFVPPLNAAGLSQRDNRHLPDGRLIASVIEFLKMTIG